MQNDYDKMKGLFQELRFGSKPELPAAELRAMVGTALHTAGFNQLAEIPAAELEAMPGHTLLIICEDASAQVSVYAIPDAEIDDAQRSDLDRAHGYYITPHAPDDAKSAEHYAAGIRTLGRGGMLDTDMWNDFHETAVETWGEDAVPSSEAYEALFESFQSYGVPWEHDGLKVCFTDVVTMRIGM